jgi:hypothetical protein
MQIVVIFTKYVIKYWDDTEAAMELGVRVMVFNTTFNNISAISWWSMLLVKETGVPCRKSLTNLITYSCIEYISRDEYIDSSDECKVALEKFMFEFINYIL